MSEAPTEMKPGDGENTEAGPSRWGLQEVGLEYPGMHMCVYVYIYIYAHMFICVHVYIYIYMCVYVCIESLLFALEDGHIPTSWLLR